MDYLKRFALWFVSGLGVTAGVMLVLAGFEYARPWKSEVQTSNLPLEQIAVTDIAISPVTKFLTIVGTITNNSSRELKAVRARVELMQGEKLLFECYESIRSLPDPGKSGHLQIECRDIERSLVPDGVSHRVRVWYAEAR